MNRQPIPDRTADTDAASHARARLAVLGLLDRLASDLSRRRDRSADVAIVLRTLQSLCAGSAMADRTTGFSRFAFLFEPDGPHVPLRELAERCRRLRHLAAVRSTATMPATPWPHSPSPTTAPTPARGPAGSESRAKP